MAALWFLAGVCFTLTSIILLLPWLRTIPGLGSLPALPWQAGIAAVGTAAAVVGLCMWLDPANTATPPPVIAPTAAAGKTVATDGAGDSWAGIANALGRDAGAMTNTTPAPGARAGSMNDAIASLQARLAKGGGSAADWELLAKSYEFLGRPAEASKARAHELPALPTDVTTPAAAPRTPAAATPGPTTVSGASVSGEVALAPTLKAQATAGATLFIVAKSVDSPGPPVAVLRTTVGNWPLKFELDDSESMLPGRNLSSAHRVTVEARISRSGQPLAAAGDLQGTSNVINTADHKPLAIVIDKVIQ